MLLTSGLARRALLGLVLLAHWIRISNGQGAACSCCQGDNCDASTDCSSVELAENDPLTGITADKSPGLGVEFETSAFALVGDPACGYSETMALKGNAVKNADGSTRQGPNWILTVDTTFPAANMLSAEYILDGRAIKIGQNLAGPAAAAVAQDFLDWNPSKSTPPMTVDGIDTCTWTPDTDLASPSTVDWQRQITAPMPLEAIGDLMQAAIPRYGAGPPVNLLPLLFTRTKNFVYVSTDFFQSSPNGVSKTPAADVMGFFSLVLTYAKAAQDKKQGDSPKYLSTIMPRTDFLTMFDLVKDGLGDALDSGPDALYQIVKVLACYTWFDDDGEPLLELDTNFCGGTLAAPEPNGKLDSLAFDMSSETISPPPSFKVSDWINALQAGTTDLMTDGDRAYDGQIGGLGAATEYVLGTTREVPIFEFRDLGPCKAAQFESLVTQAESTIIQYHNKYTASPRKAKRSPHHRRSRNANLAARQAASACASTASSTSSSDGTAQTTAPPAAVITAPPKPSCVVQDEDPGLGITAAACICDGTSTLPILSTGVDYTASCDYQTLPGDVPNPITIVTSTWTMGCQQCVGVGGIEVPSDATCTSIAGCTETLAPQPTIAAWVANLSTIDIGNAADGNNGADLAHEMYTKLRSFCPDTPPCNTQQVAIMDGVEAIVAGGEVDLKPAMYIQDVAYTDANTLDQMLSMGISTWIAAMNNTALKLCSTVVYEADADATGSGCGSGPVEPHRIRRKIRDDDGKVLWARDGLELEKRCKDGSCDAPLVCHYSAKMCYAPNEITVVVAGNGDPYANHLNIGLQFEQSSMGDGFTCEEIVDELTAFAVILAPELAGESVFEGVELDAICGVMNNINEAIGSLTAMLPAPTSR